MSISKHLVDPELLPTLRASPFERLSATTLPMIRSMMSQLAGAARAPADDIVVEEAEAFNDIDSCFVRLLIFRPNGLPDASPVILFLHGGGYVMGSAHSARAQCGQLAREIGCIVVAVDYRLAPEIPYPGALNDAYTALRWIREHSHDLKMDSDRIALVGESAGGGLAAGLALLARDRGETGIVYQMLFYPMLDDRVVHDEPENLMLGEFIWTRNSNGFCWNALLGEQAGGNDVEAYAAPARAPNLTGLPPTFIGVGSLDLFLEENLAYGTRLASAGVPLDLHVVPGAFHLFDTIAPDAQCSREFRRIYHAALRRALGSPTNLF